MIVLPSNQQREFQIKKENNNNNITFHQSVYSVLISTTVRKFRAGSVLIGSYF